MTEPIKVLIIEDDFAVARLHQRFVDDTPGFAVIGSELTAAAGAARIQQGGVDLVLLDMFLPDATGVDLLRQLRSTDRMPLDVIMLTASTEQELVAGALQLGALDYIVKPFEPKDFNARLQRYARRRSERNSLQDTALSQDQIDALQGHGHRAPGQPLPKGLSASTGLLVEAELQKRAEPATAAELAEALGMSRVSARRYLEYFLTRGDVTVQPKYGVAGRPQNMYRWNR